MYFMLLSSSESRLSHENCRMMMAANGSGATSSRQQRGRNYMALEESTGSTIDDDSSCQRFDAGLPGARFMKDWQ